MCIFLDLNPHTQKCNTLKMLPYWPTLKILENKELKSKTISVTCHCCYLHCFVVTVSFQISFLGFSNAVSKIYLPSNNIISEGKMCLLSQCLTWLPSMSCFLSNYWCNNTIFEPDESISQFFLKTTNELNRGEVQPYQNWSGMALLGSGTVLSPNRGNA